MSTRSVSEQIARATQELTRLADALNGLVGQFRVQGRSPTGGQKRVAHSLRNSGRNASGSKGCALAASTTNSPTPRPGREGIS
jgi:hypothetical protein